MGTHAPIATTIATSNLPQHHFLSKPSRRVLTITRAVQYQQTKLSATLTQLTDTHVLLKSLYATYSIPDSAITTKPETEPNRLSPAPPIIKPRVRRELSAILAYTHHLESRAQAEQRELVRLEAKLHGAQVDQAFWELRFPPKQGPPPMKQVKKFLRELLRLEEVGKDESAGVDADVEGKAGSDTGTEEEGSEAGTLVEETFSHLEAAGLSEEAAGAAARFAAAAAELRAATENTAEVAVKRKPIPSKLKMPTTPMMVKWQGNRDPDKETVLLLRTFRPKPAAEKDERKKVVGAQSAEVKNEQNSEALELDTATDRIRASVAETEDAKPDARKDVGTEAISKAEASEARSCDAPFSAVITTFALGVTVALFIVLPLALSASGWERRGAHTRYY